MPERTLPPGVVPEPGPPPPEPMDPPPGFVPVAISPYVTPPYVKAKRLRYTLLHDGRKLYKELADALPQLAPDAWTLASRGSELILTVPETVDETVIDMVLAAHDPTPLSDPPDPDQVFAIELQDVLDGLTSAASAAELRSLLDRLVRAQMTNIRARGRPGA